MNEHQGRVTTITLTIPERIEALLREAGRKLSITHRGSIEDNELFLALLERGAKRVIDYDARRDDRPIGSLDVTDFADLFGILDLEESRRQCRVAREVHEATAKTALEIFRDVEGVRAVGLNNRISTPKEMADFSEKIQTQMAASPQMGVVIAIAYVDPTGDAPGYSPAAVETIN